MTDLDGTPVALLDHSTGSAVSRYGFDPTGGVLEATTSAAPDGVYPPRLEVGWKGLFAERLDDPLTDYALTPEDGSSGNLTGLGAAVIYDVRARVYRPWLGRFLQQDPLGTGVPVNQALRWHGQEPPVASPAGFNAGSHYADGQHAMAFARSRSVGQGDPTGLFGLIPMLIKPLEIAADTQDAVDTFVEGAGLFFQVVDMADEYNAMLEMAFDWASDWEAPDDAYARSASFAMGTGFWAPDEEYEEEDFELWDPNEVRPWQTVSGLHDHHGFPNEFKDDFRRIGIDNNNKKYKAKLKDSYHLKRVHGSNRGRLGGPYNQFWEDFHNGNFGKPTKRNALAKLKAIRKNKWLIPTRWRR